MTNSPAFLSGEPLINEFVPIVRPTLPAFSDRISSQIAEIWDSGMLTKGQYLRGFENQLAEYLHVEHVVAVSSCTLGLMLVYQGLRLTGEVIVPSFTFMATVHPLMWVGVRPVFVDIDTKTWNMDPQKVEESITEQTSAIVAVHNFGNPAAVAELEEIAKRHNIHLIFDAAHGFGALYRGKPVGSHGSAEIFSLSPTKLLVSGEGGIVATNNGELAEHIRFGREYGNPGDYGSLFPGLNARMPEINALMGLYSLEQLEDNAKQRNRVVDTYRRELAAIPGIRFQAIHPEDRCSYKDLSIVIDETRFGLNRDELNLALRPENIDCRKYHDPPVHTHRAYRHLTDNQSSKLPVTEDIAPRSLSLPIWSHMTTELAEQICAAVIRIHENAPEIRQAITENAAR